MNKTSNFFIEGCEYLDSQLTVRMNGINWSEVERYSFDQQGFLDRLFYLYGDLYRFVIDQKFGYAWTGKIWSNDENGMFYQRIFMNTLCFLKFELNHRKDNDNEYYPHMAEWLDGLTTGAVAYPLLPLAVEYNSITCYSDHFDQYPHLLTVKNGVLNLQTGELYPFQKEYMLTNFVDIDFKKPNIEDLDYFLRFMNQTFQGDKETIDYFQRFLGSCLTGSNTDQIFTIFHGFGRNGKSVITSLLQSMLPDIVQNTQASTFTQSQKSSIRSDIARTKDARILIADETNPNTILDEAIVKQMSSGDMITARELYKNEISFRPRFKIILSTNHLPLFRGHDLGIKRRMRVISFDYTVPLDEIIPNLGDILLSKKESIFWWMVTGAHLWYSFGLGSSAKIDLATKLYIQESNSVENFLSSSCLQSENSRLPAKIFYDNYIIWCKQNGFIPVSSKEFSSTVLANQVFPIIKGRSGSGNYYQGVDFFA